MEIQVAALQESVWVKAIQAMAEKAIFSSELLDGRMPLEIDEAFAAAGASLFPQAEKDLVTSCSCPDWAKVAPKKETTIAKVKLEKLDEETYFRLRAPLPALPEAGSEAQAASGAILRQLGNPRGWQDARTPLELFGPLIRAAAEKARQLAVAEAEDSDD